MPPLLGSPIRVAARWRALYEQEPARKTRLESRSDPIPIARGLGWPDPLETGQVLEVLAFTKMNWNPAQFRGLLAITLPFSRLVGDIMREIPPDRDPLPQFKYYM